MGSSCSVVSMRSRALPASSATPHSSSPTSSSNDKSLMPTRLNANNQTVLACSRVVLDVLTFCAPLPQGPGQHSGGRGHRGGQVCWGGAADAERPDRVLQTARFGAGARGEAVSSPFSHQTSGPLQRGGESDHLASAASDQVTLRWSWPWCEHNVLTTAASKTSTLFWKAI